MVEVVRQYGGTWVFYVIAPAILCGVVACLWWIVKGSIGVFAQTPRGQAGTKWRHRKRSSRRDPLLARLSQRLRHQH